MFFAQALSGSSSCMAADVLSTLSQKHDIKVAGSACSMEDEALVVGEMIGKVVSLLRKILSGCL